MFGLVFSLFDGAVGAAYHFVSGFAVALAPLTGGLATAAAIVVFTVAVRLVLLPLSYYAIRGQAAQARLAPQVMALRQRHARQPERLQRELTELYRREGTGMFAGYLPMLLQLPFFSVMYRLFRSGTIGGQPNTLLSHGLLGAPLGSHWLSGPGPLSAQGMVYLGLFALLAVVTWVAARISRNAAARQAAPAPAPGLRWPAGAARRGHRHAAAGDPVCDGGDRGRGPAGGRPLPADHDGVGGRRANGDHPQDVAGPAGPTAGCTAAIALGVMKPAAPAVPFGPRKLFRPVRHPDWHSGDYGRTAGHFAHVAD